MIDGLFDSGNYQTAQVMLDVTTLRHKALAGNLANVETPGYRRVDIDPQFIDALQDAIANRETEKMNSLRPKTALDRDAVSLRADGNNVELDRELLAINENALEHQFMTQMVSSHAEKLRYAITGQK